eukprot:485416-Pleurochrysis_carterae.AAC.1
MEGAGQQGAAERRVPGRVQRPRYGLRRRACRSRATSDARTTPPPPRCAPPSAGGRGSPCAPHAERARATSAAVRGWTSARAASFACACACAYGCA